MHIYGDCRTLNQTCTCSWSQHHLTLNGPCHLIWFVTTCFLSVIALYTLFLVGSIISSVLGCISVTCLNQCMHQRSRGPEVSTLRTNYSTFVTDFVPGDGCSTQIPMADDISTAI
ncbi:hypothetical protein CAPTEDRAFT_224397 [Capitella teleta]|uniref:Uncharacterized protein n=1 Tax=Capitella teleta TaxID=283909 RepID=R7UZ34_CAPTE|nr:hypothetical protein CAPTEDRAFT_224397 [Capitella teleta]|eukprot:ELU09207.1 hypothetical protein CAPTEDRAFT_224397 [Capitella teleta]